jgi:UDP-N-acetylmuramate dehydrogenase
MKSTMQKRVDKQPLDFPSAGSVFKRPPPVNGQPVYAAKLIEDIGLKGYSIGGMQISPKHAGFIVNTGGGTCNNLKQLIAYTIDKVKTEYGITLETEIIFVV